MPSELPQISAHDSDAKPTPTTDAPTVGEGDIAKHVDSLRSALHVLFPDSVIRSSGSLAVASERSVDKQSSVVMRSGVTIDDVPFAVVVRRPVPGLDDPYEPDAPRTGHMVDLVSVDVESRLPSNDVVLRTYVDEAGDARPYKIVTEVAKMVTIFEARLPADVLAEQRELHAANA
jgi:hypothetical protein